MWFPRPKAPADLEVIGPGGGLPNETLLELLHNPKAVEWKEKVGVATPADGSAKATTRLLKSGNWVFKTDVNLLAPDRKAVRQSFQPIIALSLRVDLWHPEKFWFLIKLETDWLPVSACPLLTTIRQVDEWDTRIIWWSRMIVFGLSVSLEHGIGLDLNPSNFAFKDPLSDQLYYLDDEFYAKHDWVDIAEAVVARIPEEPNIAVEKWQQWGSQLKDGLHTFCQDREDWRHFLDGINAYPLPLALEEQRSALLEGLKKSVAPPVKTIVQKGLREPKLTCVFADVHANLPALESVLRESKKLQVDSYLFLGDVVSYGPFPRQCIRILAEIENILYLRGNHDHTAGTGVPEDGSNRMARTVDMWTSEQLNRSERQWLLSLPLEHLSKQWLAVHGAPKDSQRFYAYVYEMTYKDNLLYLEQNNISVCFYGHTHVQFMYRRLMDGRDKKLAPDSVLLFQSNERLLVNPGSVGQPRDGDPRAAFAVWDRQQNKVAFYRVAYPIEQTVNAIKKQGLPEDLMYRLEVGR